jgi:histidinol-phosphatase (PHP family)
MVVAGEATQRTALPADSHTHSQWSWDATRGSMEGSCVRAVELGLPAIAFTEHLDHTVRIRRSGFPAAPPAFDVSGYFESIERCRERFPGLRILTGLEIGEPHWHTEAVAKILATGGFDRVLGSLHNLPDGAGPAEPPSLYQRRGPALVVRDYLAELVRLIEGSDTFAVLAHIDYPLRYWPADALPYDVDAFEDEFRYALRTLAGTDRALEVNTRLPMPEQIVRWWREEGGTAVTFGSDAHVPSALARGFREAAAMVEAVGFRPGRQPYDFWMR